MKYGLIMLMSLCLVFVACDRRPDSTQAAGEVERSIEAERDHYVETTEARLDAIDTQINSLEEHATDMAGNERSNFDSQIENLRRQREMIGTKLDNLSDVNDSSWTNVRTGIDSDVSKLEAAVEDFESEVTTMSR